MDISALPEWENKSLLELDLRKKYGVNVIAIKKNREINGSPQGANIIEKDDTLIVAGSKDSIARLESI